MPEGKILAGVLGVEQGRVINQYLDISNRMIVRGMVEPVFLTKQRRWG
jgi:hypothetical protein